MSTNPYTVNDLRSFLADLDGDLPVILSSDEEGNSFNYLYDAETSKYVEYNGDGHPLHPDDVKDYDPEELYDVVVLWP